MTVGAIIKIRLFSYKSFRHYGGREITTTSYVCNAEFIKFQNDNTAIVVLTENCAGFNKGHKISVLPKDFNIN